MIRSALIALGLSAGAASAQGLVPTAPLVETCGGTRMILSADGTPQTDDLERAAQVVSARVGGIYSRVFDYTDVVEGNVQLSLPAAVVPDVESLTPLLKRLDFRFLEVDSLIARDEDHELSDGQQVLPAANDEFASYVLQSVAILDGSALTGAEASFDQNGRPSVNFHMTERGAKIFGEYTSENIGRPFAIVLRGEVISAPTIQSAIWGGSGMVTGNLTVAEATELAVMLNGGTLPFDLDVTSVETMDGSDPSADFCP